MKWYSPSKPNDIQPIPWISEEATKYLEGLLSPDFRVVEFGGGGSTLWLASRVREVHTYEPDSDWYSVLNKKKPDNVTLHISHTPLPVELTAEADLLFIDGEPVSYRALWLSAASGIVKPGGYVVLDNANRPEYAPAVKMLEGNLIHRTKPASGTDFTVTDFYKL